MVHLSAIKLGDYTVRITRNGYVTRTLPLAVTKNSQEEMLLDTFIVRQGDVTGSLKAGDSVDVTDMQRLFEHLSGAATLTDTYALAVADVNSDGWVNILDYQALYMLLQ